MSIGRKTPALLILAWFLVLTNALPAQNQSVLPERQNPETIPDPGRLPPLRKADGALGAVILASRGVGMERRLGRTHGVNGILFVASGKMAEPQASGAWPDYRVSRLVGEVTYYSFTQGVARSPGIRMDFSLADAKGEKQHKIFTAAGDSAWNETTLGGDATPASNTLKDRLMHIWLTPHGLIWAALSPDGKALAKGVSMSQNAGKTVLTIPVEGTPVNVTLGADNRPEKVQARINHPVLGDTDLEINYSGYRDFEEAYWVYFPARIVEKLGGKTVLDVTVSEFHTNPYVVFPVPNNVLRAAK